MSLLFELTFLTRNLSLMETYDLQLNSFVPEENFLPLTEYIIGCLQDKQYLEQIVTESQFDFIFPIFITIFRDLPKDKYRKLIDNTVSIFCNWLLKVVPGNSPQLRNKILRASLSIIKEYCKLTENTSHLLSIAHVLQTTVLSPPCEYEDQTWLFLMRILPDFINHNTENNEATEIIWNLSMQIFVSSGLFNPETIKILKSRPDNLAFQLFVGDIVLSLIIPQYCHPKYFEQGQWNSQNPVNTQYISNILDVLYSQENNQISRKTLFYGVCRSLLRTRKGLISFEYPIEDILAPFADAIFPLEKVEPINYSVIFDFFAFGYIPQNSDWMSVLDSAIRTEISRAKPYDILLMLSGMTNFIAKRPQFFIDLIPDFIVALNNSNIKLENNLIDQIYHICTSLNEISQLQTNTNVASLINLCRTIIKNDGPNYSKVFNAMTLGNFELFESELSAFENSTESNWLLYEGFAPRFSQNLATPESIETRLAQLSSFRESNLHLYLLFLIEVLASSNSIQHNQDLLLKIYNEIDEKAKNSPKNKFLVGFLLNLIAIPIKYQLSGSDLQKELERSSQKVRFNAGIASATIAPDGSYAYLIVRNRYSMSAFKMTPSQPSSIEPVELPHPTNPPPNAPTASFKPFIREESSRPPDTFSILASLGLFTANNKNKLEVLTGSNNDVLLQAYERTVGPKIVNVAVCRLSPKYCNNLFEANKSTTALNGFFSDLGNFREVKIDNDVSALPVPSYDTALFRFNFISTFHFNTDIKNNLLSEVKCAIIFTEGGRLMLDNSVLARFNVVIEVMKSSEELYSMRIVKIPDAVPIPFVKNKCRLVLRSNIAHEIAFILFLYESSDIATNFVDEREALSENSTLFDTSKAPSKGIDLLMQLFDVVNAEKEEK